MEEINLKELFSFFTTKIRLILIIVGLFAIGGIVYFSCFKTPMYHSSSSIILVSESNNNNNTATTTNDIILNQKLVSTYSEIIKNRSILDKVIENLNLNTTSNELAKSISVTSVKDTEIIKIEVSNKDNVLAKDIAEEITNIFIRKINNIYKLENVTVLSEAIVEENPYNVSFVKQVGLSTVIGLLISLGTVFVIYYFDTTIKNTEEIESKLGLTVLGSVIKADKK